MKSICESVAEHVALGEPLGELAEHVATCASCQRVVEMTGKLAATRHDIDPGLGFSARMTAGAQHRIVVRRRRRLAAGLAATVAAGMLGGFVITREPDVAPPQQAVEAPTQPDEELETLDDADLAGLVELADTRRSSRLSARWSRIQKPLAPYKKLVEGETP
ncbi:MAG: hypothetical protein H0T89_13300 [Deltaproteobacteria bacterium]|nr:hypothetical protein [Deltaproteobacteria bacterium]